MLCSIIWQVLQLEYSLTCFKSYFNKWKKLSIGIDFGIGIDQNSWYRYRYRPKKLVSPITTLDWASHSTVFNHSKVDYLNPFFWLLLRYFSL